MTLSKSAWLGAAALFILLPAAALAQEGGGASTSKVLPSVGGVSGSPDAPAVGGISILGSEPGDHPGSAMFWKRGQITGNVPNTRRRRQ